MGDHRASIKCEFEMHGHKATQEWWLNQDPNGCDQRITEWFDKQVEIAIGRYDAQMTEYWAEQNRAKIESDEREQLARLKEKYETENGGSKGMKPPPGEGSPRTVE